MNQRRTLIVYIDGFALYKGLLQRKHNDLKWLDLERFARKLFPKNEVVGVKFFTAALKPLTNDPGVGERQQHYWRALRTTSVEIVEGNFLFTKPWLPLHPEVHDEVGHVLTVRVKRPEEKGTDVALASHLIFDAIEGAAEAFAVITNDSDLVAPVRMLTARGHQVHLVSVAGSQYNKAFDAAGIKSVRQIRRGLLVASQFPDSVRGADGQGIKKPKEWP